MKHKSVSIQYFDWLSSVVTESFYVVDLLQKKICYVKANRFLQLGLENDFHSNAIYKEDLSMWMAMFRIITQYLEMMGRKKE